MSVRQVPVRSDRNSLPLPRAGGWFRWVICALLFFATTVCYIDRQVIGVLKKTLMSDLHWTETDYANVIFAFQTAYALGYLLAGRLFDRIGVRVGLALAVGLWSAAAMAHGLVGGIPPHATLTLPIAWGHSAGPAVLTTVGLTLLGFGAARFALGLAEGGNFPAAIKAVSEWFPRRERALATGIFNSGSNIGALVTPLVVPWITLHWGWPASFYATGALGFAWLAVWLPIYDRPERHARVSAAELAFIHSDPPERPANISWLQLLRYRQVWAFVIGMALSAPIWWFYLYWIPGYLQDERGLDLLHIGPPLVTIYLMTDVGSIGGGWLSSWLLNRGWSVNAARKTTLLICALCVVPVFAAAVVTNLWAAVLLIGLAASAHQGFSANLYTIASDTVPRNMLSSVVGIGGMAGAVGGMLLTKITGAILDTGWSCRYAILFTIASTAYLVALLIIHLMLPRLEPMQFEETD